MKKSIITDDMEHCFICGKPTECCHHVYGGHGRRAISDKEGLVIPLCNAHHNMSDNSVHFNKKLDHLVKMLGQKKYEAAGHSRESFIELFGRNYLD